MSKQKPEEKTGKGSWRHSWFKRRMARKLQKNLMLDDKQTTSILKLLSASSNKSGPLNSDKLADLTKLLKHEDFQPDQLDIWLETSLDEHKLELRSKLQNWSKFIGKLSLVQREKLSELIANRNSCRSHRRCSFRSM